MKIQHLLCEDFAPRDVFYHVGPDFEKFSLDGFGRGENNHLLGHGMYFINNAHIAKRYAKYSAEPVLYTVTLNADPDQFYNSRLKPTSEQADRYNQIANELGYKTYNDIPYKHSAMKYGRGIPGAVFEKLGTVKGCALLVKYGVVGQVEDLGYDDVFEVAVYDLDIIQIRKKDKLPSNKPDNPDPDVDAWWNDMMDNKKPS